jgi:hypothetical protein
MDKRIKAPVLLIISIIIALSHDAIASNYQKLETDLLNALRLDNKTMERAGSSRKAIQAYIREGFINKKPNQRTDYTDYYILRKPAKFMGHDLVMIEEEYMSDYVGCCVSPGAGVTVKVVGGAENLKDFANKNGCAFSGHVDLQKEIASVGIKRSIPKGNYASLSCRERDANRY